MAKYHTTVYQTGSQNGAELMIHQDAHKIHSQNGAIPKIDENEQPKLVLIYSSISTNINDETARQHARNISMANNIRYFDLDVSLPSNSFVIKFIKAINQDHQAVDSSAKIPDHYNGLYVLDDSNKSEIKLRLYLLKDEIMEHVECETIKEFLQKNPIDNFLEE